MINTENSCIAIVDDDESLRRSMGRLLWAAHFQSIAYPSAEAFLEDTGRPRFACVVIDIQLGGMSGLELRRRLASDKDVTPVIFVSAIEGPEVRAEAETAGCAGFFSKTDSGADILACIRSVSPPRIENLQPSELSNPGSESQRSDE